MKDILETALMFTSFAGAVALVGGGIMFLASVLAAPDYSDGRDPSLYEASIGAESQQTPA